MSGKRDDGAGIRRTHPSNAEEATQRASDQAEREDEFDRSMRPKPPSLPDPKDRPTADPPE